MATRTYRIELTVTVEDDHESYDDPEWLADAAWGSLTNEYGLDCTYGPVVLLPSAGGISVAPPGYPFEA